ncbi:MAG: hypothetical protein RSC84_04320 [Peptostreptococcaceae bacterium]
MRRKNIILRDKLIIDIYLIGYKNIGESLIFIIYCDERIVYSGVVDSYEQEQNKTIEILKENNIDKLNFICWTHPDEDHSIGIDTLLEDYTDINTKVILPEGIDGEEYSYNERIKNTFNQINENLISRKNDRFKVYSASDNKILECFMFDRGIKGKEEFKIVSIAPNTMITRRNKFNTTLKKNDYSIALILTLGSFTVLLSGDIENKTIDKFDYFYIPEIIDYIKTPHHTSDSSDKLINFLDENSKCEVACTTVYKKGKVNLPKKEVIEKYKKLVKNFYCTDSNKKDYKDKYGIIKISCDIINKQFTTELKGNATIV